MAKRRSLTKKRADVVNSFNYFALMVITVHMEVQGRTAVWCVARRILIWLRLPSEENSGSALKNMYYLYLKLYRLLAMLAKINARWFQFCCCWCLSIIITKSKHEKGNSVISVCQLLKKRAQEKINFTDRLIILYISFSIVKNGQSGRLLDY